VADHIRRLTAELASDPSSLAFLQLGEELRLRGQLDAAARVAREGLERHAGRADAHDLYARILADADNPAGAREGWERVLTLAPRHVGALKGLAYLAYQGRDYDSALDMLETALSEDPADEAVVAALQTVRAAADRQDAEVRLRTGADIFAGIEGAEHALLLLDARGLVLGGVLRDARGLVVSEEVAAYVAGAAQEAERAARLLDLGPWESLECEGLAGHLHVSVPAPDAVLVVRRDRSVPAGRVTLLARRAGAAARAWLEAQGG
jgi:predicted regulator of Ras-like GTPase activity (Roadblock/LC7/MglB family)